MAGVNAAIEVGKHELYIALGSAGELFAERNEPRAVKRLATRLAHSGCARVLVISLSSRGCGLMSRLRVLTLSLRC